MLGEAASQMSKAVNAGEPGRLRIGLAGVFPIAEDGELLELAFQVIGDLDLPSPLVIESARLDEDSVDASWQNGGVQDTISPIVTANAVTTSSLRPALSGTIDDPTASVEVLLAGSAYLATNRGDGTWSLPADTIDPLPSDGTYDLSVIATDRAGNSGLATATILVNLGNLDADGNGSADALSDGILILRYLFDPQGAWNVTDALSDGILILRYLFDPSGAWNISDALGSGATRTTREDIKAYLDQYNPMLSAPPIGTEAAPETPGDQAQMSQQDSDTTSLLAGVRAVELQRSGQDHFVAGPWVAALCPGSGQENLVARHTTCGDKGPNLAGLHALDLILQWWRQPLAEDRPVGKPILWINRGILVDETGVVDELFGEDDLGGLLPALRDALLGQPDEIMPLL